MFEKYFSKRIAELEQENAKLKFDNQCISDEYVSYANDHTINHEANGIANLHMITELRKCNASNASYHKEMEALKKSHVLDVANYILKIDNLTKIIKGHKNA